MLNFLARTLAILVTVAMTLAGLGLGALTLFKGNSGGLGCFSLFPGFFAMLALMIAGHEMGHLLAARAVGFRVWLVQVVFLKVVREEGKLRWRLNDVKSGQPEGLVVAYPTDDHDLRRRLTIFVAGGPLANLALGLICLAVFVGTNPWSPAGSVGASFWGGVEAYVTPRGDAAAWSGFGVILNFGYFLSNLIPARGPVCDSDGAQLLAMLRGGRPAELRLARLVMSGLILDGTPARDWGADRIERLLDLRDGSAADVFLNLYGYYHALACGSLARARELLDLAAAHREHYPAIALEVASFYAYCLRDALTARAWLERAKPGVGKKFLHLRAEAAVLLAEGRYRKAARRAEAGLQALLRTEFRGVPLIERRQLRAILEECRQQEHGTEAPESGDDAIRPDVSPRSRP